MILTNTNLNSSTPPCSSSGALSSNTLYSSCFNNHHFHHPAASEDEETMSDVSLQTSLQDYEDTEIAFDCDMAIDSDDDLFYYEPPSDSLSSDLIDGDNYEDDHLSNYNIQISYTDNLELAELANSIEISFEDDHGIGNSPNNASKLGVFFEENLHSDSFDIKESSDNCDCNNLEAGSKRHRKPKISFCEFASVKSFDQADPAHWVGFNKHKGDLDLKTNLFRTIHSPRNSPTKLWCALKMVYYKLPCNLAGKITTLSRHTRYDPSYMARISIDGWNTYRQVTARPAESSNCGRYKYYEFSFPIDDLCCFQNCIDFELAVYCYRAGNNLEYIDNNNNKYYRGHIKLTPIEQESMCPLKLPAPCKNLGEMICNSNIALTNHIFQL
jgi:hypothetical protein